MTPASFPDGALEQVQPLLTSGGRRTEKVSVNSETAQQVWSLRTADVFTLTSERQMRD